MMKPRPFWLLAALLAAASLSCSPAKERTTLSSLDELKDKRIGVLVGSTHDQFATTRFPGAEIFRLDTSPDLAVALKAGKCDVILMDANTGRLYRRDDPGLAVLAEKVFAEDLGFGFADGAVRDKFNVFLKELGASGELDRLRKKWENDSGETAIPDPPRSGKNGRLRFATSADGVPFAFIKEGRYTGLDIELAYRFAAGQDMIPDVQTLPFGSLIAALASGKTDVICSGITITAERAKQVRFSDLYYQSAADALILKKNAAGGFEQTAAVPRAGGWLARAKESFFNNVIREKRYLLIWGGLKVTFLISILSAFLGTILAGLVCLMRMSRRRLPRTVAKVYIDLLRGIPQVVLLMMMFYVVFAPLNVSGVLVATITFALNFAAYVSEMFRTAIESVKKGQTEAGIALGFSKIGAFLRIVMPQAVQRVLPVYKGEFIALVKMTAIVGYIAVQDLTKASDIIRSRTFDAFFPLVMVAVLYFVLAWLLTLLLEAIQVGTAPKRPTRETPGARSAGGTSSRELRGGQAQKSRGAGK